MGVADEETDTIKASKYHFAQLCSHTSQHTNTHMAYKYCSQGRGSQCTVHSHFTNLQK